MMTETYDRNFFTHNQMSARTSAQVVVPLVGEWMPLRVDTDAKAWEGTSVNSASQQ